MPLASRLFLRATVVVCLAAVASLFAAPGNHADAGSTSPLRPDLKTRRPNHVILERGEGVDLLRFSNEIVNRGRGPLEMRPDGEECDGNAETDDRMAIQRTFHDGNGNGVFDQGIDAAVESPSSCTVFHPEHDHWHFRDFALYELIRIKSDGSLAAKAAASSEKVGFCLVDTNHVKPGLPGSPISPHYAGACDREDATGISIGWSDLYGSSLHHQWVVITGVRNGLYCLRSTADPDDKISESRDGNNSNEIAVHLRPNGVDYKPRRPCI